MRDSIREGFRMMFRVVPWGVGFFVLEEAVDQVRAPVWVDDGGGGEGWVREVEGRQDFLSTVVAGVGTAGGFSLWSRLLFFLFELSEGWC